MAIKVVFPAGSTSVSVQGLYQWDYGQVLEIECPEIGSEIMEVHFACPTMNEAIVRPCTFTNGVGTVTIPDQCLEQANTITAWVFKIESTQGHTIKTITLSVIARKRPNKSAGVPTEYVDKYAELITEVNEAVNALESGDIVAAKATDADNAAHADTAGNAASANYATSAGLADYVSNLSSQFCSCAVTEGAATAPGIMLKTSPMLVCFVTNYNHHHGILVNTWAGDNFYTRVGNYTLQCASDPSTRIDGVVTLTADGVDASEINGTLIFYKLGGVSE